MSNKIKIVYTISGLLSGGAEISLYDICRYINKDLFEITLISILKGDDLENVFNKLPNVKIIKLGFYNRRNPLILFKLRKYIKASKPDIIHTNLPVANIYTRLASLFLKKILITTFHSPVFKDNIFYSIEKLTSKMNDYIIANSSWSKNKLIEHNYIQKEKIEIIQLGIDFSKFKSNLNDEFIKKYNLPDKTKVITYVASFKEQKGHIYLLDIIKTLCNNHKNLFFFLVGKGILLDEIKAKAIEFGIENNIIFTGNLSNVGDILINSDLFVSTSLAESFGVALVEAMYFKVPIIAYDCDAVPEIIIHEKTGYLIDLYDNESFCKTILKCLENKNIELIDNGYNMAIEKFSIENTVKNLENFYLQIMNK